MLQEEDAPNDKKIPSEIPEDEINTTETTNDEIEDLTIDTLPQKEDGSLDYEKMTPVQQFAYTCKTESVEVALKDLYADIKALEKSIGKVKKELSSLSGGNRAKLRDFLREEHMKLDELYNLRNKYVVKKKWNWKYVLIFIAIICPLASLTCWLLLNNEKDKETEPIKDVEVVNNNEIKTIGQYVETKEILYSSLRAKGYRDAGKPNDFFESIESKRNRKELFELLKKDHSFDFKTQLELDSYLGYESVLYSCSADNKNYHVGISHIDEFEEEIPNAYITFIHEGREKIISLKDKSSLSTKYKDARLHLTIQINKDYKHSKRRLLYYSLLATGYLSENELGTMDDFLNTLNHKEKIRDFHLQLRNWGFFSSEIGNEEDFCENLSTDFN